MSALAPATLASQVLDRIEEWFVGRIPRLLDSTLLSVGDLVWGILLRLTNLLENSDVGLMNKLRWSLNTIGTRVEQGICYVLDQTDKVSSPTGLSTYTQGKRGYTLWLCYESIPLLVNIRLLIMMQYHAILT